MSFFTVDHLVLGDDSEDLLGLLLLALLIDNNALGALDGAVGSSAGGIVEASLGERAVGPIVVVELFEESIVVFGKAPNNALSLPYFLPRTPSLYHMPESKRSSMVLQKDTNLYPHG